MWLYAYKKKNLFHALKNCLFTHCFGDLILFFFFLPLFLLCWSALAADLVTDMCLVLCTESDEVDGERVTLAFGVLWVLWRTVSILNFWVILFFSLDAFLWETCDSFLTLWCPFVCSVFLFSIWLTSFWLDWNVSPFAQVFRPFVNRIRFALEVFCLALCDSLIGTSLHERSTVPRFSSVRLVELYGVESFNTATGAISTIVHLQRDWRTQLQIYIHRQNKTYCCQYEKYWIEYTKDGITTPGFSSSA